MASSETNEPAEPAAPAADGTKADPTSAAPPMPTAVSLNDRYEIAADQPLPGMSHVCGTGYTARDKRDPHADLFAHICSSGLPARTDVLGALRGSDHSALIKVVDFGVVDWPPEDRQRLAIVYDRPRGGRLVKSLQQACEPIGEDVIVRAVVQPMLSALKELKGRRVFHGTINPGNLFWRDTGGVTLQLGECATAPAGFMQPTLFETWPRGLASPAGRGSGSNSDDLYALGVTLLFLLMGGSPALGRDEQEVLAAKMELGSYPALVGDFRLSTAMMEPLRGLLMDEPSQRWDLNDLELWVSGRRLSPKQPQPPRRAARPLELAGAAHLTARGLAGAMAERPTEAGRLIEEGELDTWLRRSLEDESLANRVAEAQRSATTSGGGALDDRRLARVLIALEPLGPIRYRGVTAMVEGLGGLLAQAFLRGSGTQEIGEIIAAQLPMYWVNVQASFRPEHVPVARAYENMRSYLDRPLPGYGLERCLYQLNTCMPCLSPMLEKHYVLEPDQLLRALEEVAGRGDRPAEPLDRHVLAFAMARQISINERALMALGPEAGGNERIVGTLEVLMEMQAQTKVHPLPRLCTWMAERMEPLIERFNSRTLRQRVREELSRQAQLGAFRNLFSIIQNGNLLKRDAAGFAKAKRHYVETTEVIAARERDIKDRDGLSQSAGRPAAAVASAALSALLIAGIVATHGL